MPSIDRDEPVYMISVAARICSLHPQTLRMYERLGLVRPIRISAKNRMYSDADIERLRQIHRLTHDLGVNLAGVEIILDLLERLQNVQRESEIQIERMRQEMAERIRSMTERDD
jgi:MerR family transcriptional regulator, heat shock protein HspR